jgi:hypothetical protein
MYRLTGAAEANADLRGPDPAIGNLQSPIENGITAMDAKIAKTGFRHCQLQTGAEPPCSFLRSRSDTEVRGSLHVWELETRACEVRRGGISEASGQS